MSKQSVAKPARQPESPSVIRRGADLGDGFYVVQLTDAAVEKLKSRTSGIKVSSQHILRVPKMSHAEMIDLMARIKRQSAAGKIKQAEGTTGSQASANTVVSRQNRDFLAQLNEMELEERALLEKSGQLLDSQALAALMGVTRQAINKAVAELRMFALDGTAGKKLYPAFFADTNINRRAIQQVSKALDRLAGSSKWQFFTNPRLSLGRKTPIEALRKGKFDQVMAAAHAFREA